MDRNSKIKDVYANPIGNDVLKKVLTSMGKKENLITNPIVGNLKLKTVEALLKKKVGPTFFDALLRLLNSEKDVPVTKHERIVFNGNGYTDEWVKEATKKSLLLILTETE